jgi:glutaconate CoA-transferase subunit B
VLPLSIGDPELCETALTTVSVAEMFQYWLQGGRVSIGFLAAAQIDRFANINTTVIGDYNQPKVRLPGAGGAPEIASHCGEILVIMPHSTRSLVPEVDFITSFGFGRGGSERADLGLTTRGPTLVITDLCLMRPDPETKELTVESLHPGVSRDMVIEATGWTPSFADDLAETRPPSPEELTVLRDLNERTNRAHSRVEAAGE